MLLISYTAANKDTQLSSLTHTLPAMPAKRVVLRAHSNWLDDYRSISDAWIDSYLPKDSAPQHDIRVAFVDNERFHIVIDCADGTYPQKVDVSNVPLDIYRVRRGSEGIKM